MRGYVPLCLAVVFLMNWPHTASAVETRNCSALAGEIISAEGNVAYRVSGEWQPAELGQALCNGDSVRTATNSRAAIRLAGDAVLRLDADTTLVLADVAPEPERRSFFSLISGAIQSFSRRPQTLTVDTPYVNASIEGTEFVLRVEEGKATLAVLEGTILAENEFGSVQVPGGSVVVAEAGLAPRLLLLADPIGAVEWSLYYPPVLALDAAEQSAVLVDQVNRMIRAGRVGEAVDLLLAGASDGEVDRVYAAALLLSVGRVHPARQILDSVLASSPNDGIALAQLAVIDVVQNRNEEALATAERAVVAAPGHAAPYIALSLAQQGAFRLEDARDTLLEGVKRLPGSSLLWVRLAEIWLTLGFRDRSTDAAERALALDTELARGHVMRGFAALTGFETELAEAAFARAIALEPADPLPHLGLGLARIRDGDLEGGRRELEAAVALDAAGALLRSYLGKAYFSEGRNPLASLQFEIAKELDPDDPTPYFYQGILLQTENRPGEALAEIEKSIALNDNRAPIRSELQLDQDLAARGASLGRIYEDLGFVQLGVREASASLTLDPANAAAHRFLADLYRNTRRHEIARVSELTRSQLLSDPSLDIVQPSLTETNLNLVVTGGPANAAFNEYNALFLRDGFRGTATGLIGNQDTFGGETAFAIKDGNASASVGAFGFRSDGFRENFFVEHKIFDVFAQVNPLPKLSLQTEARARQTENGYLSFDFDPDAFDPSFAEEFEEVSLRLGARFEANPEHTTLASVIIASREQSVFQEFGTPDAPASADGRLDGQTVQAELQHIFVHDALTLTGGLSVTRGQEDTSIALIDPTLPSPIIIFDEEADVRDLRTYLYSSFSLPYRATLTAGLSSSDVRSGIIKSTKLNPKIGIEWEPFDDLRLRAAYMEFLKPPLASNRTIEPSQVAGFNQLFDDADATDSQRYGVGVDWKIGEHWFLGGEVSWRNISTPIVLFEDNEVIFEDHKEATHRIYLNALVHPRVATALELIWDKFEAPLGVLTTGSNVPLAVETLSLPLTVRYFDPSGFFAGVRGTYVSQSVDRAEGSPIGGEGESDFFIVDLDAGFRLPNQRGSISIQVRNLTDQEFRFQDDGYREFGDEPTTGPYFPGLSGLARFTLNF